MSRARLDRDRPTVLGHDDVVADVQAQAGALPWWLGGEERVEYARSDLARHAGAVVGDLDHDVVRAVTSCRKLGVSRCLPWHPTALVEDVRPDLVELGAGCAVMGGTSGFRRR